MLTQADRYELKRHIIDILNDTGLPQHLKVNRLAELLEDRLIATGWRIPAFEEPFSHLLPPARPRQSPARQQSTKRKNATSARAPASARKGRRPDVSA